MKNILYNLSLVFSIIILSGYSKASCQTSPQLVWAKQLGGSESQFSSSIAVDDAGNVYTTGYFYGTADFDPGAGVFNLTASSVGDPDVFISKLDASGNFVWAKQLGGSHEDFAYSIALDASGNIYTAGYFWQTADFDPGNGTFYLSSQGSGDVFISKLDASGNFVWAKSFGTADHEECHSLALDASGNIYTTGSFTTTMDFDPNSGVFNLSPVAVTDVFISKLDPSGNFVWAKQLVGCFDSFITLDSSGNIYTTGNFQGTGDFDPSPNDFSLVSVGSDDVFVSKLDASGNFAWASQLGSNGNEMQPYSIVVDDSGNVLTTGEFKGTEDLDPGTGVFNLFSAGNNDIYISKLDSSGDFGWAKQIGSVNGIERGQSICVDSNGNVYTIGVFSGPADFDPGTGVFTLSPIDFREVFISKLDAMGNFAWAVSFGGAAEDYGYSVSVGISEKIYVSGIFQGTADFDSGSNTYNLTSADLFDVFVLKLDDDLGVNENNFAKNIVIYPNPVNDFFYIEDIQGSQPKKVILYDILGNRVKAFPSNTQAYDVSNLQNGLYFVEIESRGKSLVRKILKE